MTHTEMILICTGRSPGVPCKPRDKYGPEQCLKCQFFLITDKGNGHIGIRNQWLDQALNEGDGTYKP
jgi:hypothetical protein